jgi:hypothetical protein
VIRGGERVRRKERYLTAGMVKAGLVRAFWNIAPAEAWHRRGRKFDPSRSGPFPKRSDKDQGGSHCHRRLIQPFRHQIQLLAARPAPAEPDRYAARLECLALKMKHKKWILR